jgi:molybdenum-dependent DNA-binding transcriptional regulator ModE
MLARPIRYMKTVADHGSFTRAAAALRVSQPALSQQIRELEERMGMQLLDRSGRTVRPTDVGEAYLRQCGGRWMSRQKRSARWVLTRWISAWLGAKSLPRTSNGYCCTRSGCR